MSTVSVSYMNPTTGSMEQVTRSAGLINVQEYGEYTVVGLGEIRQRDTVDDLGGPSAYSEAQGTGEMRILTRYVIKIDMHYDDPEPDHKTVQDQENDFGLTASQAGLSQDSWKG